MYVNWIESSNKFKIKTGYYLELFVTDTIKLSGSTENKITKDEHVAHLKITEVVLFHRNIDNNDNNNFLK